MLSLYHPAADDAVDWTRGNYAVTTRSGRIESNAGWGERRNVERHPHDRGRLRADVAAANREGSVIDVAPEGFPHPVYRAGYALAIPIPLRPAVVGNCRRKSPQRKPPRKAPEKQP